MARPKHSILSPKLIAGAALRLVAKHGDFTIPGVAAALGVHPSSLYHHLPGGRLAIVHRIVTDYDGHIEVRPRAGGGTVTRYAHMYPPDVLVSVGDQVPAGAQIARVGSYGDSTGCHLHFEVLVDGAFTDPAPFMTSRGVPL